MARRFDLASLAVIGEPATLVQTVDYDPPGQAAFTIADNMLVFRAQPASAAWPSWCGSIARASEVGAIDSPPGRSAR